MHDKRVDPQKRSEGHSRADIEAVLGSQRASRVESDMRMACD